MAKIDKVRVLLVGDSGVGKTCLTHLIAHNENLMHPGWTVGCSLEVKLHEYKEGTPQQATYFIELYDIGGSINHKIARGVFYNPTHGIILVHDLTNRKSQENLKQWLNEILNKDGKDTYKSTNSSSISNLEGSSVCDPEQFVGCTQIPILVIGTKLDLCESRNSKSSYKYYKIAEQCGAEEIWLSCRDTRSLAAGTTDAVKLARFFDKVIEKKHYSRDMGWNYDKLKTSSISTPESTPFIDRYNSTPL